MENVSRRDLLKMSLVGAGALALGSVNANAAVNAKDVKFDEEWDVVIVGSGFAGLAAGITAAEKGNKVLILEKMGRVGGTPLLTAEYLPFQTATSKKPKASKIATSYLSKTA